MRNHVLTLGALLLLACTGGALADGIPQAQQAMSQVNSARLEIDGGRLPRAVELLESAGTLVPDWLVPHQWLAVVYQRQGQKELAIAQYALLQRKSYDFDLNGRANPPGTTDLVISCEALTLWLINDTRMQQSLPVLRCEPQLSVVARGHSLEMRDLAYFDHDSPTAGEREPLDRFRNVFCFLPSYLAENIAKRWGPAPSLDLQNTTTIHEDFLKSPGHRANLLCCEVDCFGVGVATNAEGAYWLTEEFAKYAPATARAGS